MAVVHGLMSGFYLQLEKKKVNHREKAIFLAGYPAPIPNVQRPGTFWQPTPANISVGQVCFFRIPTQDDHNKPDSKTSDREAVAYASAATYMAPWLG